MLHHNPPPSLSPVYHALRYIALNGNTAHTLRVRAMNRVGVSPPSAAVTVSTELYGGLPDRPQAVVLGQYLNASTLSLSFQVGRAYGCCRQPLDILPTSPTPDTVRTHPLTPLPLVYSCPYIPAPGMLHDSTGAAARRGPARDLVHGRGRLHHELRPHHLHLPGNYYMHKLSFDLTCLILIFDSPHTDI